MKSTNRIAASLVCLLVWASIGQAGSLVFINISPASVTMKLDDQQQFQAWGDDGNGNTLLLSDPQWSIDGGATLTPISYTCIVKADQPGTYTLKCREGGTTIEGTATINVSTDLVSIEVSPPAVTMDVGQTQTFTATGKDEYDQAVEMIEAWWAATGGGTLNSSGTTCTYTATTPGNYTISCGETGTAIKGTATITVNEPPHLVSIDVSPPAVTMKVGQTQQFDATGKGPDTHTAPVITPEWMQDGVNVQNSTTTHTFTATRTGHFSLTCRDITSGIEKTVGISVKAARGDTSEVLETIGSPPPMTGHTLVSLKGNLYLFGDPTYNGPVRAGGLAALGTVLNSTWILDVAEARWEEEATYDPPPARHGHAAATDGEGMYVFGGEDGNGSFLNELWAYDPDSQTWTQVIIDPPLEGVSGASAYMLPDGTIIICGGSLIRNGKEVPNYKVWRVDPADGSSYRETFTPTSSPVWYPLGVTSSGDGGSELRMLDEDFDQVSTYNMDGGEWTYQDIPEPLPPRDLEIVRTTHMAVTDGEVMRLFGSTVLTGTETEDDRQTVESWAYDFPTACWTQMTGMPNALTQSAVAMLYEGDGASGIDGGTGPSAQMASAATGPRYRIIMYGGQRTDGSLSDETVIYTPPYEEALTSITVTPGSAQMGVGETVRFVAIGHDAEDFPTSLDPVWSCTGGVIDALGFFTATEAGDFAVLALDASTGVEGTAFVTVSAAAQ